MTINYLKEENKRVITCFTFYFKFFCVWTYIIFINHISQTITYKIFLGEDIKIIPNQFCAKHKFRIGEFIMFFNKFWRIDESYKVVGIGDHLYERVTFFFMFFCICFIFWSINIIPNT